jgi:hypothetical protein
MSEHNLITLQEFQTSILEQLETGDRALHVSPYDNAYPPQEELHKRLVADMRLPEAKRQGLTPQDIADTSLYVHYLAMQRRRGVVRQRLRLLPSENSPDVAAMVEVCRLYAGVDKPEEDVRVARRDVALGHLALARPAIPRSYLTALEADVPRGGLWVIHRERDDESTAPSIIGTMDYTDERKLPGIDVHYDPPPGLQKYAAAWGEVFHSGSLSVPLSKWRELYPES